MGPCSSRRGARAAAAGSHAARADAGDCLRSLFTQQRSAGRGELRRHDYRVGSECPAILTRRRGGAKGAAPAGRRPPPRKRRSGALDRFFPRRADAREWRRHAAARGRTDPLGPRLIAGQVPVRGLQEHRGLRGVFS